jgi:hypothetical protein
MSTISLRPQVITDKATPRNAHPMFDFLRLIVNPQGKEVSSTRQGRYVFSVSLIACHFTIPDVELRGSVSSSGRSGMQTTTPLCQYTVTLQPNPRSKQSWRPSSRRWCVAPSLLMQRRWQSMNQAHTCDFV